MPGKHALPRTCKSCGKDYTLFGKASLAEHRYGTCPECREEHGVPKHLLKDIPEPDMYDGLCYGVVTNGGEDLWYSDDKKKRRQAKAICNQCPVRELCLDYALEAGEPAGIWGGTSPEERHAIRRRKK